MLKAFLGYLEGGGYQLVSVGDGFLEEFAVIGYHHQSVLWLILGIEQTDVYPFVAQLEVMLQHAIVEQKLHIVRLQLITVIAWVCLMGLYVHVASRFLLHQQFAVGGHQVHTSLDAECFADERRFQDGFLPVVELLAPECCHLCLRCGAGKENIHHLLQIESLQTGIGIELLGIKPGTGAELQGFLPEIGLHRLVHLVFAVRVDDVVQCCSGKVTQQGGLGVGSRLHQVEKIEQRMVTESREAGGDATDIYQIVGLYHDESGCDDGLLHLAVEQVELHAFLQKVPKIGMVDVVLLVLQSHQVFLLVGILVYIHTDKVAVPVLHDAADAAVVDFQSLLVGAVGMWDEHVQFVGHIHSEHGRDEDGEGTCIILQIFA